MFGELAGFLFAVNKVAVNLYVEHASRAFDHFRFDAQFLLNGLRQTGGLGVVVSLHAVLDGYCHFVSPSAWFGRSSAHHNTECGCLHSIPIIPGPAPPERYRIISDRSCPPSVHARPVAPSLGENYVTHAGSRRATGNDVIPSTQIGRCRDFLFGNGGDDFSGNGGVTLGLRARVGRRQSIDRLPDAAGLGAPWHWNFSGAMYM